MLIRITSGRVSGACGLLLAAAVALSARTYTLTELIEAAFRNSPRIKAIQEELIKADAARIEAAGGFLPRVDLSARYQYTHAQHSPIDFERAHEKATQHLPGFIDMGEFFEAFSSELTDPVDHTTSLYLTVTQPLFAQTAILYRYQIVKHQERSLLCVYQSAQQRVKASVIKLFYRALLARKNEEIQGEAVELADEGHRLTVLQFELGKGSEIDTLRSRLHVEKTQIDHRSAESARRTAWRALIKASGVPETEGTLSIEGHFPSEEYSVPLAEALETARTNNKGLGKLQSAESIRELRTKMAWGSFFPRLTVGGAVGKAGLYDDGDPGRWEDDARVFATLSLNLFDGFGKPQRLRQALSEQRRFDWEKEQVYDSLELAVQAAWEEVGTNRRVLDKSTALVELAEKAYAASHDAYKVGAATQLDLQRSELELRSARLVLNESQFAYHSAVVDLRVVMGTALVEGWQ
jgi:outer membrane protein TolC